MHWSVIVPSCSDEKIIRFVWALLETHPNLDPQDIFVVSDGLSEETRDYLRETRWVQGVKPFVYARAINMGVAATDPDSDLVIVGDDVLFQGESNLDVLALSSEGVAAIVPEVYGVCGCRAQWPGRKETSAQWVTFICTYIPRGIWQKAGPLDERFVGYGYDDVDWCIRARQHGPLVVRHDIRVFHAADSSYRTKPGWESLYEQNRIIFEEKWRDAGGIPEDGK